MEYIEGMLSEIDGEALAKHADGKVCLEIGSYMGKSANYIAETAKLLYCMDTFKADMYGQVQKEDFTTLEIFRNNTKRFTNIITIIGDSKLSANGFKDESLEMVFIDGMHDYESVKSDIDLYLPKLVMGGIMCFHDYYKPWYGVIKAVDECFGKPDYVYDILACCVKR